eukprot:GILK01004725.1.p1 GENE.GILK01004725.1~~GILK01004725.1.p1  ORF type:complete len:720 (+),score=67.29 GILK01004725.1:95-2254(+)
MAATVLPTLPSGSGVTEVQLGSGEVIISAWQYVRKTMTTLQILAIIVTFGIYYLVYLVLKPEVTYRFLVTNFRIILIEDIKTRARKYACQISYPLDSVSYMRHEKTSSGCCNIFGGSVALDIHVDSYPDFVKPDEYKTAFSRAAKVAVNYAKSALARRARQGGGSSSGAESALKKLAAKMRRELFDSLLRPVKDAIHQAIGSTLGFVNILIKYLKVAAKLVSLGMVQLKSISPISPMKLQESSDSEPEVLSLRIKLSDCPEAFEGTKLILDAICAFKQQTSMSNIRSVPANRARMPWTVNTSTKCVRLLQPNAKQAPSKYLMTLNQSVFRLSENENVLTSIGRRRKLTLRDKILTVLTLGLHYVFEGVYKRRHDVVHLLTDSRLVHHVLMLDGNKPSHFRSDIWFYSSIKSVTIKATRRCCRMKRELDIDFQLPFRHGVQRISLPLRKNATGKDFRDVIMSTIMHDDGPLLPPAICSQLGARQGKDKSDFNFDKGLIDTGMLMPEEMVVATIRRTSAGAKCACLLFYCCCGRKTDCVLVLTNKRFFVVVESYSILAAMEKTMVVLPLANLSGIFISEFTQTPQCCQLVCMVGCCPIFCPWCFCTPCQRVAAHPQFGKPGVNVRVNFKNYESAGFVTGIFAKLADYHDQDAGFKEFVSVLANVNRYRHSLSMKGAVMMPGKMELQQYPVQQLVMCDILPVVEAPVAVQVRVDRLGGTPNL